MMQAHSVDQPRLAAGQKTLVWIELDRPESEVHRSGEQTDDAQTAEFR